MTILWWGFTATRTRCIQRNPTKGIESFFEDYGQDAATVPAVAFKEIPQRELRDVKQYVLEYGKLGVAFKEIPQRELRDIEELLKEPPLKWDKICCIQRNPTKGIESFGCSYSHPFSLIFPLHSKKSHKGN